MTSTLYLDTARLGRMCRAAQAADRDFARLVGKLGCSLYYENFLKHGFSGARWLRDDYPRLTCWSGLAGLRKQMRRHLRLAQEAPIWLAGRSLPLVRLAMRVLCRRASNVMVTDLEWPVYVDVLRTECRNTNTALTEVSVRRLVFREHVNRDQLVSHVRDRYRESSCDGLFLSAVSHLGVRQPVEEFTNSLPLPERPRFIVVDGAQAFNHVPLEQLRRCCDVLLTGCHKWVGAYYPLTLALGCNRYRHNVLQHAYDEMLASAQLDDPLLRFLHQCESPDDQYFAETVNVGPLITGAAALSRVRGDIEIGQRLEIQQATAIQIAERSWRHGWRPRQPALTLRSGILLLQARSKSLRKAGAHTLRDTFHREGLAVTAYQHGIVRLSMPRRPLSRKSVDRITNVLRKINQ